MCDLGNRETVNPDLVLDKIYSIGILSKFIFYLLDFKGNVRPK